MDLKNVLVFCFVFSFGSFFSQDLIIKKDGKKIYCEILKVDSVKIFYNSPYSQGSQTIALGEVKQFFKTSAAPAASGQAEWQPEKLDVLEFRPFIGISLPFGAYANEGGALSGPSFGIDAVIKLNEHFGLMVNFRRQENYFDPATIGNRGHNTRVTYSYWSMYGCAAGFGMIFPVNWKETVYVSFDLTGGAGTFEAPDITVRTGNYFYSRYSSSVHAAFADFAFALSYRPLWNLAFSAGIDFIGARPEFRYGTEAFLSANPRAGISLILTKKNR